MVKQLDAAYDPRIRAAFAALVPLILQERDPDQVSVVLDAADRHPELRGPLSPWFGPIHLDSDDARLMREQHESMAASQAEERRPPPPSEPTPVEQIGRELLALEGGDLTAWLHLVRSFSLNSSGRRIRSAWASDLSAAPLWTTNDEGMRERLISAAEAYLRGRGPEPEGWFEDGNTQPSEGAVSGFKALRLLRDSASDRFARLEEPVWVRWLPILLTYPSAGDPDNEMSQRELIELAYARIPEEVLALIPRIIDRENGRVIVSRPIRVIEGQTDRAVAGQERREEVPTDAPRRFANCWDDRIAGAFREKLQESQINAAIFASLVEFLIRRGDRATTDWAISVLNGGVPDGEIPAKKFRVVTQSLLVHATGAAWPDFRRMLDVHPDLGRDILVAFRSFASPEDEAGVWASLTAAQLADLYLWLDRHLRQSGGAVANASSEETPSEALARLRHDLLGRLAVRGSPEAVSEIDRLITERPGAPALVGAKVEAVRRALEFSWAPPAPVQLLELTRNAGARLVRSEGELLRVVLESLQRYERELQGETPGNFTLWDRQAREPKAASGVSSGAKAPAGAKPPDRFRPKEEERISDALKLHLGRDLSGRLLTAVREVELHTGADYTDLYVTAPIQDAVGGAIEAVVRIIVEVKGCWHPEVREAMQTKLRDRYLSDNDCHHGLYVVGWFYCDNWDASDYRKGRGWKLLGENLDAARTLFKDQASQLSTEGFRIESYVIDARLR